MKNADGWARGGSNGGNAPRTGLVSDYIGDGRTEDKRP